MGSVSTRGTTSTALPECSRSNPTNYQPESNSKALNGKGKLASKYCIEEDKSVKNGPSASTVIIHSNETKINSQKDKNIMLKQVKSKEKDPCAICLGPINDETELDNCTHTFCFICTCEWLKNSGKCPLCKAPVMQIKHSLHKKEKLQQVVLLSTLQAEAEAARLSARGSSQPPHDEITCIQLRIRRIQKKISHIQHMMNKNKAKYSRSSDLARLNEQAVDELNRLDLLKREAASMTRGELLGNLAFRRIIYEDNLDWSPIDRNAIRLTCLYFLNYNLLYVLIITLFVYKVPFTPANCLASESESRARLIPFINRELMIVWLARRPNGKDVLGASHRKQLAWDIISTCLNHQINSPAFAVC
uniref:RING-type E3 ubiquitin transferase n=1 Tax=Heterorhabditis bacteriophora TaxID=37862 RepID=A0A1I7X2A6_HETBA